MMGEAAGGFRIDGGGDAVLGGGFADLTALDGHVARGDEADAGAGGGEVDDSDFDIVADPDGLAGFAAEDQHTGLSLACWGSVSTAVTGRGWRKE